MKKLFPLAFVVCIIGAWASLILRSTAGPKEYESYYANARSAYEKEYYLEALRWLSQAEALPGIDLPYEEQALKRDIYLGLGEENSYVAQCLRMTEAYPETEENYLNIVRYYKERNDYQRLYQYLPDYCARFPNNAELTAVSGEMDRMYDYRNTGYYDVRYASDTLVDIQATQFTVRGDELVTERRLCRSAGGSVFDMGYARMEVSQSGASCFVCGEDGIWKLVDVSDHLLAQNKGVSFESVGRLSRENIATVLTDGKYHFINNQMLVSDLEWEEAGTFSDGVNAVKKDGRWALVTTDTWGSVTEFPYTDIAINSQDICNVEGLCVVADQRGYFIVSAPEWQQISENFYEELKAFESVQPTAYRSGGKWGFVNNQGNIYIEACYEDARPFRNGYAAVKQNGLWGYIDKDGNMIVEPQFQDALSVMDDGIAYVQNEFGYWDYIRIAKLYYGSRG